jgi:hypothetical protein
MEHVRQETRYFTAVEPEAPMTNEDGKKLLPSRWRRWCRWWERKLSLIDQAVDLRIIRWGQGS